MTDRVAAATPAGEVYAAAFGHHLATVRDNLAGVLAHDDPEPLHRVRVAVRRSRAVLRFATGVVGSDVAATYAPELKWIGSCTSRSRDLDVHLPAYDALAARVPDAGPLEPFRERLVAQRREAHADLDRALRSRRFAALVAGWEERLAGPPDGELAARPVGELAPARLATAWRRVLRRGDAITVDSPPERWHDLRKRGKELRYVLELFAGLDEPAAHEALVAELKRLQDGLGALQDVETQRLLVGEQRAALADEGAAAATLRTLDALEEQLAADRSAARAAFPRQWAIFVARTSG
jgi:CHAD domain-containing protein